MSHIWVIYYPPLSTLYPQLLSIKSTNSCGSEIGTVLARQTGHEANRIRQEAQMAPQINQRVRLSSNDEKLIQEHMPLVKIFARRFSRRLPASVAHDDLLGAGALGLIDSVKRRRGSNDSSFACYTRIRIRGAIFDELRSNDWLPRRSRSQERRETSGEPHPVAVIHFDDLPLGTDRTPADQSSESNPLEALTRKRIATMLRDELNLLPERDRLVLHLHYFKGMRLKEIGRLLGVSEARVSQIHHRALHQLRPKVRSAA